VQPDSPLLACRFLSGPPVENGHGCPITHSELLIRIKPSAARVLSFQLHSWLYTPVDPGLRFASVCTEVWAGGLMGTLIHDLLFSVRVLRKTPGFTITAILTLAMTIGANAVVFGVLNALILRPLNVPQPESLYTIERGTDKLPVQSYPDYLDLRDRNSSFGNLTAANIAQVWLDTGQTPSRVLLFEVSGNYFDALGIQPYLGRVIHQSDEHGPNSAPYIVLSYAYWHSRFQGDAGVVGRTVQLNKHPFTVIGVAPPKFHGTLSFLFPDFFAPIVDQEQLEG